MPRIAGLFYHLDFLKLWTAQTLAALSANVTNLALPLIAALTLHASPFEMGLLGTVASLPNILVGLFVGPWTDRVRRRPLMIAADIARALLLVSIPVASRYNLLTIWQLYAVLFFCGIGTTIFEIANVSYLPSLVGRKELMRANSRIVASASVAGAVGPGLAGGLVQLLSAPLALLVDACSLALSAILVHTIRSQEPFAAPSKQRVSIWRDIADGLGSIFHDRMLRSIALASMIYLFFNYMIVAIYVLYATRNLAIAPSALGMIFGIGGISALLGAIMATAVMHRVGIGPTMIGANLLGGLFTLLIPLAGSVPSTTVLVLALAQGISQMMGVIFYINRTSLLQAITPDRMLGRMNSSYRFLTMGSIPIGSFLGGMLGETIGLHATIVVGGLGMLISVLWLVCSPLCTFKMSDAQE